MLKFSVVDAFTRSPFQGNQAAVFLLDNPLSEEGMLTIAKEINYSETAFVTASDKGDHTYHLRWFTPEKEIDLCGHATLAASHAIWEEGKQGHAIPITFTTQSQGPLNVSKRDSHICMNFPTFPLKELQDISNDIRVMFPGVTYIGESHNYLFVELESGEMVEDYQPNQMAIEKLEHMGLIITVKSHRPQVDFVNRCFFPKFGVPEDPVTGSAYCALGPYWFEKLGQGALMGEQISKRTGRVHVEKIDDARIMISGQAITTFKGIFTAPVV